MTWILSFLAILPYMLPPLSLVFLEHHGSCTFMGFHSIVLTQHLSSTLGYTCGEGCTAFSLLLLSSTLASGGLCRLDPFTLSPSSSLPPACFHACGVRRQGQCVQHDLLHAMHSELYWLSPVSLRMEALQP